MVRFLFLAHRYLGIAVGLVMLLWTVSGIIMMYQEYPELDSVERRALLAPIELSRCCATPPAPVFTERGFRAAVLEMQADTPVLRVTPLDQAPVSYALENGRPLLAVDETQAQAIADAFAMRLYPGSSADLDARIDIDQWTVSGAYNFHRPLYHYRLADEAGTELYVSSRNGEIVQLTTTRERVWGYLGAVIHWLYPTVLRQHSTAWSQTVIWLSVMGVFLTAVGLYIGIRQFLRRRKGRASPYRGMALLHHYTGLVFGILTLTWVLSGLFSMNPWGALQGEGIAAEAQRLTERPLSWMDIEAFLDTVQVSANESQTLQYRLVSLAGSPQVIAYDGRGNGQRLDPDTLGPAPLGEADLSDLANRLQPGRAIASTALIEESDAYYYEHHLPQEFPVYRVIFADDESRRYYLSPVDGRIVRKIDRETRWYRWLFNGLHRGDFTALSRSRPLWDGFMLILLLGVTAVCVSGCVMAWRRLRRDLGLAGRRPRSVSRASQPSVRGARVGGLLVLLSLGLAGCQEEVTGDWIEVPLSDATFYESSREYQEGEYEILVLARSALEYKLGMDEGDAISYAWDVDMERAELLTTEFHGHTHRVGEEPGTVMFYKIHQDGEGQGSLIAPFDGIHGWYFNNQSEQDISIQLRVAGFYEVLP